MGKKSKKADINSEPHESGSETVDVTDNIIIKDKKSRKRKSNNDSSDLIIEKQVVENEKAKIEEPLKKNKSKKKYSKHGDQHLSKISVDQKTIGSSKESEQVAETNETEEVIISKKKKTKNIKQNNENLNKNKKIIFEEDTGEPVEIICKNKSDKNDSDYVKEEDVKDEDIDQFCDDITEEDNVQYENWVQLIEAKLKSNKSKTKT